MSYRIITIFDIRIALGDPSMSDIDLIPDVDYVVYSENALNRISRQLDGICDESKSIVITCAGKGSRLGMGLPKALVKINGNSLIYWQLKLFEGLKDIRIVVGYKGEVVIKEVLKYRKDVIFCFNHAYEETKTGASFFIGAKHANHEVIEWDGDLLVHPDDAHLILSTPGEYICYSDISSEQVVYVNVDNVGNVLSFSRDHGNYEWTGPACAYRENVVYTTQNVFNILEPLLPMKGIRVRAYDVDTYDDFIRVSELTKKW